MKRICSARLTMVSSLGPAWTSSSGNHLRASSPLWSHPKVTITPHVASFWVDTGIDQAADLCGQVARGETLSKRLTSRRATSAGLRPHSKMRKLQPLAFAHGDWLHALKRQFLPSSGLDRFGPTCAMLPAGSKNILSAGLGCRPLTYSPRSIFLAANMLGGASGERGTR